MRRGGDVRLDQDEVIHLVRAAQEGDPRALDALLARLRPPLLRLFARRLEEPDAAEDLVQATLLRIAEGFRRIDPERVGSYVVTVALNRLRSEWRRRQREALLLATEELSEAVESPSTSPDREAEYRDLARAIHGASANTLPPELREVLVGVLRGLSPSEIAAEHHLSPVTIRARLQRARAILHRELESYTDLLPARDRARSKGSRVRENAAYPGYRIRNSPRRPVSGTWGRGVGAARRARIGYRPMRSRWPRPSRPSSPGAPRPDLPDRASRERFREFGGTVNVG